MLGGNGRLQVLNSYVNWKYTDRLMLCFNSELAFTGLPENIGYPRYTAKLISSVCG